MLPDLPKRPRHVDFENRPFTLDEMRFLGSQPTFVTLGFKDCPIGDDHVRELRNLPRLTRLWLEGTQITDAALAHVATLPKLEFLVLDRTGITGEGFRHLHDHPSLKTLWASETRLTDQTAPLAAAIPKLSILRIPGTAVTFDGLLTLATNPRLKVVADGLFSPEQLQQFEATQRRLARQSRASATASPPTPNPDDTAAATRVLLDFFSAMNAWEHQMAAAETTPPTTEAELLERRTQDQARCAAIFDQYCTPKPRSHGRPAVLSYSMPPTYSKETIVDTEHPSKGKIWIYTKDASGFQHRYLITHSTGQWRVDHRESLFDGWTRDFL